MTEVQKKWVDKLIGQEGKWGATKILWKLVSDNKLPMKSYNKIMEYMISKPSDPDIAKEYFGGEYVD